MTAVSVALSSKFTECVSGINTLYWHQQQLCAVKAQGRVPTVFIVELKRGLLRGNKNTQGEIAEIAPIVCEALWAGPGGRVPLLSPPSPAPGGALAWRSQTFRPLLTPLVLAGDTQDSPWQTGVSPTGAVGGHSATEVSQRITSLLGPVSKVERGLWALSRWSVTPRVPSRTPRRRHVL